MNKKNTENTDSKNGENQGKKYERITLKMGRPRKFNSADDLFQAGCDYINNRLENGIPLTVTGLCIALGTTRETFIDYESGKYNSSEQDFSYTIKRLKQFIEEGYEQRLFGNNPTGAIFALKNLNWKDSQDIIVNDAPEKLSKEDIADLAKKKQQALKAVK